MAVLSYESPRFGSHGYCALGSNRGHLCPFEKPTIDLRSESIGATLADLIGGGEAENVMGCLYEDAF
jgi:hypothetical protein